MSNNQSLESDPFSRFEACRQFDDRMQSLIDARETLLNDTLLHEHATTCHACRQRLETWLVIGRLIQSPAEVSVEVSTSCRDLSDRGRQLGGANRSHLERPRDSSGWWWVNLSWVMRLAVAASFCIALLAVADPFQRSDQVAQVVEPVGGEMQKVQSSGSRPSPKESRLVDPVAQVDLFPESLDPTLWWQDVANIDWLAEAMPAVESMSETVAPIGRSIRRAFAPIAIGTLDQTS